MRELGVTLPLTPAELRRKRIFDVVVAGTLLVGSSPLLLAGMAGAAIDTRSNGIFSQTRIGQFGRPFRCHKLQTMRTLPGYGTTVTTAHDPRITRLGGVLRNLKIDELPQLIDVLKGDMSMVGPRPDVPGWADQLQGSDRIMLSVPPGITGPASLAYRHEQDLLACAEDPEMYNRDVLWPAKVQLNCDYVRSWSLRRDVIYLLRTVTATMRRDGGSAQSLDQARI